MNFNRNFKAWLVLASLATTLLGYNPKVVAEQLPDMECISLTPVNTLISSERDVLVRQRVPIPVFIGRKSYYEVAYLRSGYKMGGRGGKRGASYISGNRAAEVGCKMISNFKQLNLSFGIDDARINDKNANPNLFLEIYLDGNLAKRQVVNSRSLMSLSIDISGVKSVVLKASCASKGCPIISFTDMTLSNEKSNTKIELFEKNLGLNSTFIDNETSLISQVTDLSLPSDLNIDYSYLRTLLSTQQWKKADFVTTEIMTEILKTIAPNSNLTRDEKINKFPCTDLRTIDTLWTKYSNGRFGFSVQNQIWQSLGGKPGEGSLYSSVAENFSHQVGLRNCKQDFFCKRWDNLNFTLQAPRGHLPAGMSAFGGIRYDGVIQRGSIASNGEPWRWSARVEQCQL